MKNKLHIKKGDNVIVISGKDKGKEGKVLSASISKRSLIVEGVNMMTKHTKARKQGEVGGIVKQEAPIFACKVMVVCPKCHKPARIGKEILKDGKKARVCKKCHEIID